MTELSDKLNGDLVVVYQHGDLALVESFWGRYSGQEDGRYKFNIARTKELLLGIPVRHRIKEGQDILIDFDKITRLMAADESKYETTWSKDMGLDPDVQEFYDGLSLACDIHCSGWAGPQVEVFFKKGGEPLYGKISHEVLDAGMLGAKRDGRGSFTLDTFESTHVLPISGIDRIMVYSWQNGPMGGRSEEVGYQATSPSEK